MISMDACVLQARKRAAWREARLKSLEQDAMQAEMVIKRMSEYNQSADNSSGSLSSSLRTATNPSDCSDDNGNNNRDIPDYTNNNEVRYRTECSLNTIW